MSTRALGWVAERQNRYADALSHAEQALALYQASGDQARRAAAAVASRGQYRVLTEEPKAAACNS